jgi:hypothetical protein
VIGKSIDVWSSASPWRGIGRWRPAETLLFGGLISIALWFCLVEVVAFVMR